MRIPRWKLMRNRRAADAITISCIVWAKKKVVSLFFLWLPRVLNRSSFRQPDDPFWWNYKVELFFSSWGFRASSRMRKGKESNFWVLLKTGSFPSNQVEEDFGGACSTMGWGGVWHSGWLCKRFNLFLVNENICKINFLYLPRKLCIFHTTFAILSLFVTHRMKPAPTFIEFTENVEHLNCLFNDDDRSTRSP